MTSLVIIRGVPGSGKSTLARHLVQVLPNSARFEADQFFETPDGEYKFDPELLHQAHKKCLNNTRNFLHIGGTAIVSNTFTTIKELKPYFKLAKEFGIIPQVILCQNEFGSIHDVPDASMEKMRGRFVYDLSPLFQYLNEVEEETVE